MKKIVVLAIILLLFNTVSAQEVGKSDKIEEAVIKCSNCNVCPNGETTENGKICMFFFYGETCPHCAEEKPFLEELEKKYPNLEVHRFEVYFNSTNVEVWKKVCEKYNVSPVGVPMTFIGNKVFVGFVKTSNQINSNFSLVDSIQKFGIAIAVISIFIVLIILWRFWKR